MAEITTRQINLVAAGLRLLYTLYGRIDEAVLFQALQREVRLPHVTRVPSWEDAESLIEANPDFLSTEELQAAWESRTDTQSRIRLMIPLGRELRRREGDDIYLFRSEIRDNSSEILPTVMSVIGNIRAVLDDPTLSGEDRVERVFKIIEEAANDETT